MKIAYQTVCGGLMLALSSASNADPQALPKLNVDIDQVTVSGLSSGGYMAGQFHVANADWVSGVGIVAAGPYYCARNSIMTALSQCVSKVEGEIPLNEIELQINQWREQNLLAPKHAMKDDKVWILHGTLDNKVVRPVVDALYQQYQSWLGDNNLVYINDKPFAHHFPTLASGADCNVSEAPFVASCDFAAASIMLEHIAGYAAVEGKPGKLITVDQQALGGDTAKSLADEGYLYIPGNCLEGQNCKLHISFHGCNQNAEAVGDAYASLTGINAWADNHNTLVLYPQTKKSSLMPMNPQACWDWWGYTDEYYATKQGQQMSAVTQMVRSIKGN
ncbi:PHB depolymerase family esterase [Aliiglaciecola sp. CAU 1673]|uniref:extracellular catalytic domain type 2 short-chain-length polyhydroxyalkanoate depolymerase n=1 Tax=Aliiglaciecola sp. CAU 1673 TaxID=3032595 RepID=UPI0023DBAC96|nr:PHB depolymerase family esterase [Aliiglaciecola sp. CAU 1673]MDF2179962.1 PHB depolymerase family esterase [Aliiglaciecola sp. CAU 1673]